jgi:hypothetical protein
MAKERHINILILKLFETLLILSQKYFKANVVAKEALKG